MKDNFIHVCFVIDESGSMGGTEEDVIGGFKKVIDEQAANDKGTCAVSYFKFSDDVTKVYIGKDIKEVKPLTKGTFNQIYTSNITITPNGAFDSISDLKTNANDENSYWPHGCTAMFDGIGTAIDVIGKWLNDMPEEERPEKNLIVIMTDGEENASREYTKSKVSEMIKHQEEKYNWTFIYMGSDLTNANDVNSLGMSNRMFSSKDNYSCNYDIVNEALSCYRCCDADISLKNTIMAETISLACSEATVKYAKENGLDANDLLDNKETKA